MKIATALWGFRKKSMEEVFEICERIGVSGIEAHCHQEAPGHFSVDYPQMEADRWIKRAAARGLAFVSLAGANDFTLPSADLADQVAHVKKLIDLAVLLQVKPIRVFAGFIEPAKFSREIKERMLACLRETARYARKNNCVLALENHGGITATAEQVKAIVEMVNDPGLGVNYDPANFVMAGEDPMTAMETLGARIVYAHVKDVQESAGKKEHCAVGDGVIPWDKLLPRLAKIYNGPVAIEYERAEDAEEGTARSLEFLKRIINI